MNKLFEESFGMSQHIWYKGLNLYKEGKDAKELVLFENIECLLSLIKNDLQEKNSAEYFWYIYGKQHIQDALSEKVRPNLMIRFKDKEFLVRLNFADADFALSADYILDFEKDLADKLKRTVF
ncbi:hypothetical protein [Lactococcus garvieae]|uniref:hypothetical protein n=1 Tax=Lactococcus garvieae TaxID=1363 RepID=UPI0009C03D5C|nr:hypothetical protein [Lactococcus garvieae]